MCNKRHEKKFTTTLILILSLSVLLNAQNKEFAICQDELKEMNDALDGDSMLSKLVSGFGNPESLYKDYKKNLYLADSIWNFDQNHLDYMDIGETETFEIMPLIDWFTDNDKLIGEGGVSYLIKTDDVTLLFDLGQNASESHPSPLLKNMERLGISIDDIDMIVISHNQTIQVAQIGQIRIHSHLRIINWSLKIFLCTRPSEMTYPGLTPRYTPKPTKISKGVATIGVIHKPIFFIDIAEQAIAVNVKNKGIAVITGCGHQSIKNILERTKVLFREPLYGVLGGFHYTLQEGRNITWFYKYVIVNKLPWERLTVEDVNNNIRLLKESNVKIVGVSGHDNCDKSIELFKDEFGDNYVDIVVGRKIAFNQ